MSIDQIYKDLKIMPSLQKHQKIVAAIAWKICDSLSTKVDTHTIVSTCLLHDLGNIVKGSSDQFAPKGEEEYWQKVETETKEKFGEHASIATVAMIKSLNLENEEKILEYLSWVGAKSLSTRSEEELKNLEFVIAPYADSRVAPNGIVSIDGRIEEAKERYHFKDDQSGPILKSMKRMEVTIFARSWMTADEIKFDTIEPYLRKLDDFDI
ncbi:HD domain-containing protein [Candidatus Dojkabacteria bacterium]|uniref:HD domain-containing protein n=1 Tax=Candidatus Dojkabacteria bacterium TaxID=2099670 RepID=A0A955I8P0_9BACT|nr:HD domain-containing protein [Candidatus Dojkabacteria bacterium]